MMSQLSQEFDKHMQIAEKFAKEKDLDGAEALRLIAESIHGTLSTFEVIKVYETDYPSSSQQHKQ